MRCLWCSNPESQFKSAEIMLRNTRCTKCLKCLEVCNEGALNFYQDQITLNSGKCNQCLKCASICTPDAIVVSGKEIELDQLMIEIEKDRIFYENSGGGVTASGGEPLMQWRFIADFFRKCREKSISTSLDTCGYASKKVLE